MSSAAAAAAAAAPAEGAVFEADLTGPNCYQRRTLAPSRRTTAAWTTSTSAPMTVVRLSADVASYQLLGCRMRALNTRSRSRCATPSPMVNASATCAHPARDGKTDSVGKQIEVCASNLQRQ